MKINCTIDGEKYSLIVSADKPLNKILQETSTGFGVKNKCLRANCGNCFVMVNNQCMLSCLVPAFKLNGCNVETFESFRRTRAYRDIEKAFGETGNHPCSQCYASKVLLMESILRKMEKASDATDELVSQEMSVNNCQCLETNQMRKIIQRAFAIRSRRNDRKA